MLRRTLIFAAALCLGTASAAGAQPRDDWTQEAAPLWAKLNVCHPGEVGVRASLPGDGGGGSMAARFTLEWLNPATQAWEPVDGSPTSPWLDAGSADVNWSQVGYTFDLEPIPPEAVYSFRGVAELKLAGGAAETLTTPASCTLSG